MIARPAQRAARLVMAAALQFGVVFSLGLYAYPGAGFVPYLLDPRRTDFALYYRDARLALTHGWANFYNPTLFAEVTRQVGVISKDPTNVPSLSMPHLTWLVAAVAWLPLPVAYCLWLALLGACLAVAWWLLAPPESRYLHLGLLAGYAPALMAWGTGQSVTLVAAGVAVSAVLLRRRLDVWAGVILGLASFKPQLLVALPFCLVAAGRWRTALAWAGTAAAIVAVHLTLVGPAGVADWLERLRSVSANPGTWQVTTSVSIVLLVSPGPLRWLLQAAILGLAALVAYRRREQALAVMGIGLIGSLLVTPYLHYPDLLLLLLAGWMVLRERTEAWERLVLALGFPQAVLAATSLPQFLPGFELAYLAGRPAAALLDRLRGGAQRRTSPQGEPGVPSAL